MDAILLKVGDMRKSHARRLSSAGPSNAMADRWNQRGELGGPGYSRDTVVLPTLPDRGLVSAGVASYPFENPSGVPAGGGPGSGYSRDTVVLPTLPDRHLVTGARP